MKKVIVLGHKGRFGRHAAAACRAAGWQVTTFGRGPSDRAPHIEGDATDVDALVAACCGQDVIVNALNPLYPDWAEALPRMTKAVIAAAMSSGARVVIPGNMYNYGAGMPARVNEATPWRPTTRKGRLRVEMEQSYRAAGVRTLVVRAGDYIDTRASGNWFDLQIAAKARAGRSVYPGPRDIVHAWAYLPDVARATVALLELEAQLAAFEEVLFPGFDLTGHALVDEIARATGMTQKVSGIPWRLLWLMGLVNPMMREIHEMRYLWSVPHGINGARFAALVPGFTPTPLADAIALAVPGA